MNTRNLLTVVLFGALTNLHAAPSVAAVIEGRDLPNVVLIFADDLGYGDLSCYGAEKIKTTHLDQLAAEGMRFTDAHSSSAVCSPSRYGLLTGEYPFRVNYWGPVGHDGKLTLDASRDTIADVFKHAGYATAYFGKWHLGFGNDAPDWNEALKPGPLELGFDYFYGIPCANSVPPYVYVENHYIVGLDPADPIAPNRKPVYAKKLPEKGAGRIGGGKAAHQLYVDERIGTNLTERSIQWMDSVKDAQPFFLALSTTNIHHPFTPAPQFKGSSEAGLYGDFTVELDWITGQVMDFLEQQGIADNTLVIFSSDNGGMLNNGGQTAIRMGHDINGDLLGSKFGAWEGGHRVPMIVRWPNKVPAGTTSDALISHVDLLATFAAITGQKLEEERDSLNQLATLTGTPGQPIRTDLIICPNNPAHLSIRQGDWVYIPTTGDGGFTGSKGGPASVAVMGRTNSDIVKGKLRRAAPNAQLYNLEQDPAQTSNVIADYPEVAQKLAAQLANERATIPNTKPIGWIAMKAKKK
ncbi:MULTISPECIES: arylsulfatase [unclassified Lentimonas]|uniref:sulfatase family protein n=1 Tax=unclassified Lentimonas TaxID=2630993 RepID=UPI0013235032|nr:MULTISPECIES: arylsulfatase [unclassified Lentimonas]CAA6677575.1 Choline-sulfatase (EC [Lentimonas sp. CC4]CAA6684328.1 Choline-sulfatase (EC [Lentimonas sp. CC6]CAA7078154.1 Choline-sulfatase (EC [Lentimonas sp. CC4]CAA7168328.1 Choline-sulfatase (EC [Lentimonas sp. CC21]CAA7181839.1 Choline-sulfatase (EC [Lentimonas sp. CC8]